MGIDPLIDLLEPFRTYERNDPLHFADGRGSDASMVITWERYLLVLNDFAIHAWNHPRVTSLDNSGWVKMSLRIARFSTRRLLSTIRGRESQWQ